MHCSTAHLDISPWKLAIEHLLGKEGLQRSFSSTCFSMILSATYALTLTKTVLMAGDMAWTSL